MTENEKTAFQNVSRFIKLYGNKLVKEDLLIVKDFIERTEKMSDCDKCTWRDNPDMCAIGMPLDENDEPCPGYEIEPCKKCNKNPCVCYKYQQEDNEK